MPEIPVRSSCARVDTRASVSRRPCSLDLALAICQTRVLLPWCCQREASRAELRAGTVLPGRSLHVWLQASLTVCAEPEQQGLDQQGLYVKGPKPYLCSYLANFVFICFVLSLFVFICFCLSFICNCLLLFYLGPGFVLYVYNTSPRPQSALV